MNEPPGVVKFAALLPATERGNTINVTAEPGTRVPGVASQSMPTVQPAVTVPIGWPGVELVLGRRSRHVAGDAVRRYVRPGRSGRMRRGLAGYTPSTAR